MKKTLTLLFIALYLNASATTYYISSSGNDSANGLSESTPWKTISKLNSSFYIIKPGDRILFKRGDTFYGTIKITKSGTSGSPIYFGAYGTGDKPVITGFTTISSWTNVGGGVYSTTPSCEGSPEMLIIDGVQYGMGRYPNKEYLKYESFSTNLSITDNELSSSPNWSGAEVVIRKTNWILDRCLITSHSGSVINYKSLGTSYSGTTNYGYFFQNDIKTLDIFGEWYFNGTTLYVYFGNKSPDLFQVKVSTVNNLVLNNSGYDNIKIENISLRGANQSTFYLSSADYFVIQNCDIDFSGENGIFIQWGSYVSCDNNLINNSNRAGIYCAGGKNVILTNNTIRNSGIIPGAASTATQNNGIYVTQNDNGLIQYNDINYSGGNGIYFTGNNVTVKNNLINNSCQILHDCGGVYTTGNFSGRVIEGNIILNSFGNTDGTANPTYVYAEGIFTDAQSQNITIKNNTAAFCRRSGIFFHESHDNICTGNTCFDNLQQVRFQFGEVFPDDYIRNITFSNNILIAKEATQYALWARSSREDIPGYVIADYNYYARPVDDSTVIYTQTPVTGLNYRTLGSWQKYTNQDENSKRSSVSVTNPDEIRFEYNASKENKVISLDQPMIDIKGNKYSGSITLLPYTSVVLMVDPNPVTRPEVVSSTVENTAPNVLEIDFSLSLSSIIPPTSAFTVMVNSESRTVSSVAVSGTKVQLTLSSPVTSGDKVTVAYTTPSTDALRSSTNWWVLSFSTVPVENKVDALRPVFVSATIESASPNVINIQYSLNLSSVVPPASAFTVMVNSVPRTVTSVNISSTVVQLTLAKSVTYGDKVTIAYTIPSTDALRSSTGWWVLSFDDQPVTNKVNALRPVFESGTIESISPNIIDINFSLNLSSVVPPASAFTVMVNSVPRTVNSVYVSGSVVQLTLSSPVTSGDKVTVAYTIPSTDALRSTTGWWVLSFNAQPVTNKVDDLRPVFVSATVESTSPNNIDLNFSLDLYGVIPPASAFIVMVNSVPRTINSVFVSGSEVHLTLSSPVTSGDKVTVAYTIPSTDALRSTTGWWVLSFDAQPVTNNLDDLRPVFVSAAVESTSSGIIDIYFSLNLSSVVPPASAFSVMVNSVPRTVNSVFVSGSEVHLTLSSPVTSGDKVTVAYTTPSTDALRSTAGWWVLSFNAQPVTNKVDSFRPVFVSATVESTSPGIIDINFSLNLSSVVPPASAFKVMVNSVPRTVNSVYVSGSVVQLTLSSPVIYGDNVTVAYTIPPSDALRSYAGWWVLSFSSQTVTNNVNPISFDDSSAKGEIAENYDTKTDVTKNLTRDDEINNFLIFPNPAREFINIKILGYSSEILYFRIYDITGKLCQEHIIGSGVDQQQIPLNLNRGIYNTILIRKGTALFTKKVIVTK